MSNYAKINYNDLANGIGVRTSIFFSGCEFFCDKCFNSNLWDFNCGSPINENTILKINQSMNKHIRGLSVLGGEPMHPKNVEDLYSLIRQFKNANPQKDVWLWSGYTWEELTNRETKYLNDISKAILCMVDVLVDGRYEDDKRDLTLAFRGSRNQRVIDVQKTLQSDSIVLYIT